MSGKFDQFAIKNGYVKEEDVQDIFKIRICKDRTLSITQGQQKPFNDVAIAVISVPTKKEADDLITFVGKLQWQDHPQTRKPWYRFLPGLEYKHLEYEDLPRVANQLRQCLNHMRSHRRKTAHESV